MKFKYCLLLAFVFALAASAQSADAASVLKVYRVGMDGTSASLPAGAALTRFGGDVLSENPAVFTEPLNEPLVTVTNPQYEVVMGYCFYPIGGTDCTIGADEYSGAMLTPKPSGGGLYTPFIVRDGQVTKMILRYGQPGSIRVERVGSDGTTASAPAGTSAVVTGYGRQNPLSSAVPPVGGPMSSANPAEFPNLSHSPKDSYDHTVHVTHPSTTTYSSTGVAFTNYPNSVLVGTCKYTIGSPVCDIPTDANNPESFRNNYISGNDGGIGTIPGYLSKNVQVEQGKITRVVVKYMTPAPLSPSNQAIPVGGQTAQSIYQAQVQAAAAAPVTPASTAAPVVPANNATPTATPVANVPSVVNTTSTVTAPTQPAVAVNNAPVINAVTNTVANTSVTTTVTPVAKPVVNTPVPAAVNNSTSASSCTLLTYNLAFGSRDLRTGGNVTVLQNFLRSAGYLNSESSGYFGSLTLKAVKDYQIANGISAYGYVGPITRASINPAITKACK